MPQTITPRREFLRNSALGALAMSATAFGGRAALAYQGNMERTLAELQQALQTLDSASSDKGGHRVRAMNLIKQAMGEVEAGIAFAAEHFGD